METLPSDKSHQCIFRIIKEPHRESCLYGSTGEYYLGLYLVHHSENRNIFLVQKHLVCGGSEPSSGWIDADKVKVIGWTEIEPDKKYREGLIEA